MLKPILMIALGLVLPGVGCSGAELPSTRSLGDETQAAARVQPKELVNLLGQSPAFTGDLPSLAAINVRDARIETVLSGLTRPWAFEFIADDEVLVTEIGGRLLRYRFGDDAPQQVPGLPEVATTHPQQGLLDIALHPDFAKNRRIYFTYAKADPVAPAYTLTALATARLGEDYLHDVATLLEAGPYNWSPSNFGGALAFDDRGFLYVSIGDRGDHDIAQRVDRLQGKILRLNDDGSVPDDNPFVDDPGVDDRIYALGVRNPQGLDFDAPTGRLFEAEHGPLGGDEINIIRPGANYGWPVISYGKYYNTADIGIGTHAAGMEQPIYYYTPSEAISPLLVYRGAMFPEWEGDLLVGALRGKHVSRLDLDGEVVRSVYPILGELDARIRDLKVGSDGAVFVLTEPGNLHRLYRAPSEPPAPTGHIGSAELYELICSGCHATGAYGAPDPDLVGTMDAVRTRPREEAYRRTIEGYALMPTRGLCDVCDDDQLRGIVDYMLDQAGGAPTGD
jgi:aldose sugar dehydrogenase